MINSNKPYVSLSSDIPPSAREWRNDPRVRNWCRQYTLISRAQHEAWLKRIEEDASLKMFGVMGHGAPVGVCGLTSIDRVNQRAEFSLYIAPTFQSKGYGKAALHALLDHGFNSLNLNRIWGESFDLNPAQKMFQSLGLKHEGTQKQAYFRCGGFIDSHIWAITRGEFNALYSNRSSDSDQRASGYREYDPGSLKLDDLKPITTRAISDPVGV